MPKPQQYVQYNDEGHYRHALVIGEESPENYDLYVIPTAGEPTVVNNVPKGTSPGTYREHA